MNRNLKTKMQKLRVKLGELWDAKGRTDQEILELSVEYDKLLNKYYRLQKQHLEEF